mmetsp:Transcript_19164/g.76799  ORF Transcript_19164/g.76799 Transcript_19164/m.76799 type:complete len:430 (+) Transcript_19164:846-2135(+)
MLEAQKIFMAESIGIFEGIVETIGPETMEDRSKFSPQAASRTTSMKKDSKKISIDDKAQSGGNAMNDLFADATNDTGPNSFAGSFAEAQEAKGRRKSASDYPAAGAGGNESSVPLRGPPARSKSSQRSSVDAARESLDRTSVSKGKTQSSSKDDPFGLGVQSKTPSKTSRPSAATKDGDLLGIFDEPVKKPSASSAQSKQSSGSNLEDLMGFSTQSSGRKAPASAEGDLLGDFNNTSSKSAKPSFFSNMPSSSRASAPTSSQAPKPAQKPSSGTNDSASEVKRREELRKQHKDEIQSRADEKLAEVRDREEQQVKENDAKDGLRDTVQPKLDNWTGKGSRRGNIRALLCGLDQVLYKGTSWKGLSMDQLKQQSRVKIHYHKAVRTDSILLAPQHALKRLPPSVGAASPPRQDSTKRTGIEGRRIGGNGI